MTSSKRSIWLLGPQYHLANLGEVFRSLELAEGPVALVTAGWQEREGEDDELDKLLDGRSVDLEIYRRADKVFRADPELRRAHGDMQRMLREIERLYDSRLSYVKEGVMWLLAQKGDLRILDPEREHALGQLRELDEWHLKRIVETREEFERKWTPLERDAVVREREALAELVEGAASLVIAGGHVAVLLNRLRLFDVTGFFANKTILAWSAGAMVLTERVVLFHDHPPQGPGNAEVMEQGLGLCPGIVALPDGKKRLDLDDPHRVASFAQRFAPDACIVLGEGDCVRWDGSRWSAERKPVLRLGMEGEVEEVSSW